MINFNEYPYRNLTDLNLDYLEKKMNVLKEIMDTFVSLNTVTFADPIIWNITTQYARNTVVLDTAGNAYLSKVAVPVGVQLNNSDYWLEIFNFTEYTRTANQNLTINVETDTTRATHAYNVDDWLIWNDVLYKVTSAIAIDDTLIIGTNIVHFTVEDFIKAFMTWATNTIQQYKNDIDASELQYRQQLAQDIASTTASLQAQLNQAISGATVDSEVINARIGWDSTVYATLGEAIRDQITAIHDSGMLVHGTLPNNTDLNNIIDNGIYIGSPSFTYTNCPLSGEGFTLEVIDYGFNGLVKQTIRTITNTMRYTRRKISLNTWSNWRIDDSYHGLLPANTDLNDIKTSGAWTCEANRNYSNSPVDNTKSCYFECLEFISGSHYFQFVTQFTGELIFYRCYYSGAWQDWQIVGGADVIANHGILSDNTDLNNIINNGIYIGSQTFAYTNCPLSGEGFTLEVIDYGLNGLVKQTIRTITNTMRYTRRKISLNTWSNWRIDTGYHGTLPNNTDLNDIIDTTSYIGSSSFIYLNMPYPSNTAFILECYNQSSGYSVQIIHDYSNKYYSYSRHTTAGVWSDWTILNTYKNGTTKLYAFGDSTTHGSRADNTTSPNNYPKLVAHVLGMDCNNQGVNGQGLLKDWTTINNAIDALDMSDANLIIVAWAYNDATLYPSTNFGAYTDVVDTTFIGKYYSIMKKLQTKCPEAKLILLTGYGCPLDWSNQFTHAYTFNDGPKTIKEIYDEQEKMCNLHGWSCINQSKGTFVNEFNHSIVLGDHVHPTDNGYLLYSNFLAGQISSMFVNIKNNL